VWETTKYHIHIYMQNMCVCVCVCACVCVCVYHNIYIHIYIYTILHTYIHTYISIYIYTYIICVRVCVCVCVCTHTHTHTHTHTGNHERASRDDRISYFVNAWEKALNWPGSGGGHAPAGGHMHVCAAALSEQEVTKVEEEVEKAARDEGRHTSHDDMHIYQ